MKDVGIDFHKAMVNIYEQAKEFDFFANRFKQMLDEHGGVGAAKILMLGNNPQTGLMRLWEEGRLDISVEKLMCEPRFKGLFTPEELAVARQRLEDLGYRIVQ